MEAKKEPRKNRLVAVFSVSPPTRLLQFVNLSASLHFSATDYLELAEVTATHESITVKFDYFRDVPEILASLWIDLNATHFVQSRVTASFVLRTTLGEPLLFDPWADFDYSFLKGAVLYFSLAAVAVSALATVSYKMIGVETLHTFQLVFFGMLFSRRYATFFNNFEDLVFTLGQSSPLFPVEDSPKPFKLAALKYSATFEANVLVVGSCLLLAFAVRSVFALAIKVWEMREKTVRGEARLKLMSQRQSLERGWRLISDYFLLPIGLSFFFHFALAFACESYLGAESEHSDSAQYRRLASKFVLSFVLARVLSAELLKAFVLPSSSKLRAKTRKPTASEPLQLCEPAPKYVPLYIVGAFFEGFLIAGSLLLGLPFFVEAGLGISALKLAVVAATRPYRMAVHNWGICYNAAVLVFAFAWLTLEEFYLLSPSSTKTCATVLLGALVGVLALAGARVIGNACFILKTDKADYSSAYVNDAPARDKDSKEEELLGQRRGKRVPELSRRREKI